MRLRLISLWVVFILSTCVAAAAQENPPASGAEQARQILDRSIQALGGAAYLNVRDITRRGRLYSFDRGELADPGERFVDYVKFPGKERLEIGKKGNIVYINDNDQGWELDRQGIREMTPAQTKDFMEGNQRDIDYLLRIRLQQEKLALYYLGREFSDNRTVHVIELVDETNESVKLLIDAGTYLPMQLRYRIRDILSGDWVDVVEHYGKYITVQGITTPLYLTRQRAGVRTFEVYFTEVQYNTGVPDALFTRGSLEERWRQVKK